MWIYQTSELLSRYDWDTKGSTTDAAVTTKTRSDNPKLLDAGKTIPEADSIVLPELHKQKTLLQISINKYNETQQLSLELVNIYLTLHQALMHRYKPIKQSTP